MGRETVEALDVLPEGEAIEARLAAVERAYEDVLQRLRRYESERAEIRARLEQILARIDGAGPGSL